MPSGWPVWSIDNMVWLPTTLLFQVTDIRIDKEKRLRILSQEFHYLFPEILFHPPV